MKPLLIILAAMLLLQGCTTYDIIRKPDGTVIVKVRSSRSFEAPDLHYKRTGNNAEFTFGAASVQDGTAAMIGMFGKIFDAILVGDLVPKPQKETP